MAHNTQSTPRIDIPGRAQQVPSSSAGSVSPQNIHYLDDSVQEDAKLQVQWSEWMEQNSFHQHVFVLLLSWHPECDDMAVDDEVNRLRTVFETRYNYQVQNFYIDDREFASPQAQVNLAVATFVHKNDRDNALFIVYYAGHGSPGKRRGELNMSGRRRDKGRSLDQQFSHITWNLVENNLRSTKADILLIFDCCYSSDLGRDSSAFSSRSFEYLAASDTDTTRSPGPSSFTSALIWALEKLSRQPTPTFLTSKLAKTICECPDFPPDQTPPLTTRDYDAWKHIFLAPLPREGMSESQRRQESEEVDEYGEYGKEDKPLPQFLTLTFQFKEKQDEKEFRKLATHLKTYMKAESTALRRVRWDGIWLGERKPPRHRLRNAVLRVMSQTHMSATRSPTSPCMTVHGDRLSPQAAQHPELAVGEETPLLSGAASVSFEHTPLHSSASSTMLEPPHRSLWDRFVSFCRGLRKPRIVEPQANTKSATTRAWTSRLRKKISRIFKQKSSRVRIAS